MALGPRLERRGASDPSEETRSDGSGKGGKVKEREGRAASLLSFFLSFSPPCKLETGRIGRKKTLIHIFKKNRIQI